jgi:hypothetical protein
MRASPSPALGRPRKYFSASCPNLAARMPLHLEGRLLPLKGHDDRRITRERLGRAMSELEQASDDLRADQRAQAAISSAIAFVQLVLEHHLDGKGPRAAKRRPP